MLIRNILEESVRKFDEVKAVKWLKKKEIMERSYEIGRASCRERV